MALVAGRERTCVTRLFRDIQIFSSICYMKLPLNRHTSINLLLQFNVDALKKLAQHILEKKIENPLKTLPRENEVTLQKFVPGPTVFRKIIGQD